MTTVDILGMSPNHYQRRHSITPWVKKILYLRRLSSVAGCEEGLDAHIIYYLRIYEKKNNESASRVTLLYIGRFVTSKRNGERMSSFESMPKSIKKAVRYIYQDAPDEHLKEIQKLVNQAINQRLEKIEK
jgi:hypothetical protein